MRNITIINKGTINPNKTYEFQIRFVFPSGVSVIDSEQFQRIKNGEVSIEKSGYSWVEIKFDGESNSSSVFSPADYERTYHSIRINSGTLASKYINKTCEVQVCIHLYYANGSTEEVWSEKTDFDVETEPTCDVSLSFPQNDTIKGKVYTYVMEDSKKKECMVSQSYVVLEQDNEIVYREQFYSNEFKITNFYYTDGVKTPTFLYVEGTTELGSSFCSEREELKITATSMSDIRGLKLKWKLVNDTYVQYLISDERLNDFSKLRLIRYTVLSSSETTDSIEVRAYQTPMVFEGDIKNNSIYFNDYTVQDNEKYVYKIWLYKNAIWYNIPSIVKEVVNVQLDTESLNTKDGDTVFIYDSSTTNTDCESDIAVNQPIDSQYPKITKITRKHNRTGTTTGILHSDNICNNTMNFTQDAFPTYRWLLEQQEKMTPFLLKTMHGNMIVVITKISSSPMDNTNCIKVSFDWVEIANANSLIDLYKFGFSDYQIENSWKKKGIEGLTAFFVILK